MAEEREMWTWDFVAWLCFWMPRYAKRLPDLANFHPLRLALQRLDERKLETKLKELGRALPERLTEAEIEDLWKRHKEAHGRE